MAQETAVHRWDAESATDSTTPIDPYLAADGIDELIDCFYDGPPGADLAGTTVLQLDATDVGRQWRLALHPDGVVRVDTAADVEAKADVSTLLLALWQRVELDGLDGWIAYGEVT